MLPSLPPSPLPASFLSKKSRILSSLSVPVEQYDDLSPKGSVDVGIRELIDEVNAREGYVTTSSCAGRISVFLEGRKGHLEGKDEGKRGNGDGEEGAERATTAGVGGKGGGGRWLFVSHDPVDVDGRARDSDVEVVWAEKLGMRRLSGGWESLEKRAGMGIETRFIHFKFEPMILHILTASLQHAQIVLSAALQAGFRESGALNLVASSSESATPMVGVRSMGLALESVVGFLLEGESEEICMVPEWQLKNLIEISNKRFVENTKRIERFRSLLKEMSEDGEEVKMGDAGEWESKESRRARKREEGLRRAEELRASAAIEDAQRRELEQNL